MLRRGDIVDFIFFLLPVFIAMTICIFMTKRWGMGEKVDKGIAFCYWKLSYRRKFIRTLWMIPIEFVVLICFHNTFQSNLWYRFGRNCDGDFVIDSSCI